MVIKIILVIKKISARVLYLTTVFVFVACSLVLTQDDLVIVVKDLDLILVTLTSPLVLISLA